jgi:hypothetical protein
MHESKSFIYLDLQKTGTNFIVDFLERFNSEGKGRREKHRPARANSGKFLQLALFNRAFDVFAAF